MAHAIQSNGAAMENEPKSGGAQRIMVGRYDVGHEIAGQPLGRYHAFNVFAYPDGSVEYRDGQPGGGSLSGPLTMTGPERYRSLHELLEALGRPVEELRVIKTGADLSRERAAMDAAAADINTRMPRYNLLQQNSNTGNNSELFAARLPIPRFDVPTPGAEWILLSNGRSARLPEGAVAARDRAGSAAPPTPDDGPFRLTRVPGRDRDMVETALDVTGVLTDRIPLSSYGALENHVRRLTGDGVEALLQRANAAARDGGWFAEPPKGDGPGGVGTIYSYHPFRMIGVPKYDADTINRALRITGASDQAVRAGMSTSLEDQVRDRTGMNLETLLGHARARQREGFDLAPLSAGSGQGTDAGMAGDARSNGGEPSPPWLSSPDVEPRYFWQPNPDDADAPRFPYEPPDESGR